MLSASVPKPEGIKLQDVAPSHPAKTVEKGARLISRRTGIVRQLATGVHYAGDPRCFALGIEPCDTSRFSIHENSSKSGGAGLTLDQAIASTLGETVERYSMLFYDKDEMVLASARQLGDDAVRAAGLSLVSRQQVQQPHVRAEFFDEDTVVRWTPVFSLTEDRWKLAPACQVYLNYRADQDEQKIAANASTGLAAGNTIEEAIQSGLYEVLERDAFTICWLHEFLPRRIKIDDQKFADFLDERFLVSDPSVHVKLFDITLDLGVPCVLALMDRPSEAGRVASIGAATRLDPKAAVTKSLLEIAQTLSYYRYLRDTHSDWEPKDDFSDVNSFDEHCTLYLKRPELIDQAYDFCHKLERTVDLSQLQDHSQGSIKGDLTHCIDLLRERGLEVLVADITTDDVREVGLHVVRVIVPGVVPLHGDHTIPFLGLPRLQQVPYSLGWEQQGWSPEKGINPLPHPFP